MSRSNTIGTDRMSAGMQVVPVMVCFLITGLVPLAFVTEGYSEAIKSGNLPLCSCLGALGGVVFAASRMAASTRKHILVCALFIVTAALIIPVFSETPLAMGCGAAMLGFGASVAMTALVPLLASLSSPAGLAVRLACGAACGTAVFLTMTHVAWWAETTAMPTFGLGWKVIFMLSAMLSLLALTMLAATPFDFRQEVRQEAKRQFPVSEAVAMACVACIGFSLLQQSMTGQTAQPPALSRSMGLLSSLIGCLVAALSLRHLPARFFQVFASSLAVGGTLLLALCPSAEITAVAGVFAGFACPSLMAPIIAAGIRIEGVQRADRTSSLLVGGMFAGMLPATLHLGTPVASGIEICAAVYLLYYSIFRFSPELPTDFKHSDTNRR